MYILFNSGYGGRWILFAAQAGLFLTSDAKEKNTMAFKLVSEQT